jgi:lipoprotein
MLKTKIKRKIKKDKLNVIYWTVLVVSACFLMLTNIDWQLIGGIATGTIAIVQFLFDKDFTKKYFE